MSSSFRAAASTTRSWRFWWRPNRDWQVQNLTLATGGSVSSRPDAWADAIRQFADRATPQPQHRSKSLIVVWDDGESRRLTDATGEPITPLRRKQGRANIMAILWDPKRPTDPAPDVSAVEDVAFGAVKQRARLLPAGQRQRVHVRPRRFVRVVSCESSGIVLVGPAPTPTTPITMAGSTLTCRSGLKRSDWRIPSSTFTPSTSILTTAISSPKTSLGS